MHPYRLLFLLCAVALAFTSACTQHDHKADIHAILDARDEAVSQRDINAYSNLLLLDYSDLGRNKAHVLKKMNKLFAQVEKIDMQSDHRIIRLLNDNHAECEQNYQLRVYAYGEWRELHQRERITLTNSSHGWKISGGL